MNATLRWMGQNRLLTMGLVIIVILLLISLIGPYLIDEQGTKIGYALPDQSPSREFLLGTDTVGRQMLPTIIVGMPLTLRVGIIAGALGLTIGVVLGLRQRLLRWRSRRNNPRFCRHVAYRSGPVVASRRGVHAHFRAHGEHGSVNARGTHLDGADPDYQIASVVDA